MNEDKLKEALSATYAVDPLADDRMDVIARKFRVASGKSRTRKRVLITAGICLGLGTTVGFTYPIAEANLFGRQVEQNFEAMGPYMIQISAIGKDQPGSETRKTPISVLIDGKTAYMDDSMPGDRTFVVFDAESRSHTFLPNCNVELIRNPQPGLTDSINVARQLMKQIGNFDMDKRIERRGTKTVNGRQVEEVGMRSSNNLLLILDIDSERHIPVSLTLPVSFGGVTHLRYDYVYDPNLVAKRIETIKAKEVGMKPIYIERGKPQIKEQLFAKALSATSTGRDKLKIYQVNENAQGDVFVLYTCSGYHADEDNMGPWLQLKDDQGKLWLTEVINMFDSKLAPKGEGLKAQLFFHPKSPSIIGKTHFSIRQDEWEFMRPDEKTVPSTHELNLGSFVPTPVNVVPEWFFYSFLDKDERWLPCIEKKIRFKDALSTHDFQTAIRIGREFYDNFPEMEPVIFFTRPTLAKGLAKAYRAVGDLKSAKEFEAKSKGAADYE